MKITPKATCYAPGGAAPSFGITTDGARYYTVQITTDAILFNGSVASRRSAANFWDSWSGDLPASGGRPDPNRVAGSVQEAPKGVATYTLPVAVWKRLSKNPKLFYRLLVYPAANRAKPQTTLPDADYKKAPSFAVGCLPASPTRSAVSSFVGTGALADPDFIKKAAVGAKKSGMVSGRDLDYRYVVLDASKYRQTVIECHEWGLTDTIAKMPRKPDAVINAQFIQDIVGVGSQGQVIRDGLLINSDSQPKRYFVAQLNSAPGVNSFAMGLGNPNSPAGHNRHTAIGGLGPLVLSKAAVAPPTDWVKSVFAKDAKIGKGAIALHKTQGVILLIVQENSVVYSDNSLTMKQLQDWLAAQGFDDALFNDGSDSESLYAKGGWLLTPGYAKDEAMDFALGFVRTDTTRPLTVLAIDGTKTKDAETFAKGIGRPLLSHFRPHNCADDLKTMPGLSGIAGTFKNEIIEAWQATTPAQASTIGAVIIQAGHGGSYADIMYISSHAWRQGELWFHPKDTGGSTLTIAHPWQSSFKTRWNTTPQWLVLAGCGVLGLRYSRGIALSAAERSHLITWHHDIHGASATVPGLTPTTATVFETFHPGFGWYNRIFKACPGLRGILGYWFRSPSDGNDVAIMTTFADELREGASFLVAWQEANERAWYQASAPWAAMIRSGAESDTLASCEEVKRAPLKSDYVYYDAFMRNEPIKTAFSAANTLDGSATVGGVTLSINKIYDKHGINDLKLLSPAPAPGTFLQYNDGITL